MYRYYWTRRGIAPGCQPSGFVSFADVDNGKLTNGRRCYGYIDYKEPLTDRQVKDYELTPHTEEVQLIEQD